MQKFNTLKSIPAYLPIVNIDTDMIIPKQFLKTIKRTGLGKNLFFEMRYDDQGKEINDFVLNTDPYNNSKILIAGKNFGCGSSREHAPWALLDFGITCVISSSFADIFYNNCFKNGILPIILDDDKIKKVNNLSKTELAICLVKKNPMDTILQKATELGISKIIPIVSERTEVKELNLDRAKKIVIEATEQSNQLVPPEIIDVIKLKDFLKTFDEKSKILFADVNSKENLKAEDLKNINACCILIGPEGDFSSAERELILQNRAVKPFTLSRNILRSDTAVISAISLVNFINNFN